MSAELAISNSESMLKEFLDAVEGDLAQLSALLRQEVSAEMLRHLKEVEFPANLGFRLQSSASTEALETMTRAMAQIPMEVTSVHTDDLAADFANIFLLNGYRVSPYESVWRDEEQLERQLPMFQISKAYEQHGLTAANRRSMPEDHISLQLEFIGHLCQAANEADDLRTAAQFLDDHLLIWIDEFAQKVATRCACPFYAGISLLSAAYVNELRDDALTEITGLARPDPEEQNLQIESALGPAPALPTQYVPGMEPSW